MKVTHNAVKIGKVDKYVGLYLTINEDTEQMMRVVRTSDAKETVEVIVNYKGHQKEYTLSEFLQKLGFEEQLNQTLTKGD